MTGFPMISWDGPVSSCPTPRDGNNRFAPDGYISFGVPRDFIWDMNLPKLLGLGGWQVAGIGVGSRVPKHVRQRPSPKARLYLRLGFREYWLLDPEGDLYGKPITGLHRVGNEFEEYEVHAEPNGDLWAHSELLGLEFWWLRDALPSDPLTCETLRRASPSA